VSATGQVLVPLASGYRINRYLARRPDCEYDAPGNWATLPAHADARTQQAPDLGGFFLDYFLRDTFRCSANLGGMVRRDLTILRAIERCSHLRSHKVADWIVELRNWEGQMNSIIRWFAIFAGVVIISLLAGNVSANTATVRCVAQQDQISVYDSLRTRGVEAKLKCGEEVEIIGRVQHYLKIRAQNGVEGYVPDNSLAGPPAAVVHQDAAAKSSSVAVTPAQNATQKKQPSSEPVSPSDTFADNNSAAAASPLSDTSAKAAAGKPGTQPEATNSNSAAATPAVNSDDAPAPPADNESADPACQNYFSAYGLAPSQLKWIAQNRKKLFSNICPAPDISKVDYVMIFTHDVDFFNVTMPTPVHKIEGFSDFRALTPIDTGLTSASDPDKAHHQYVWIFRVAPGTFDPENFSPRRRYQFSTVESNALGSKAGLKAVEDAFRFVSTANH
jgi:hypothetical protein